MAIRQKPLSYTVPDNPASSMPALDAVEPVGPHLAQRALDTLPSSVRVLGELGLQGSGSFTVPAAANPTYNPGVRIYPDVATERVAYRLSSVQLTPGHVVELQLLAIPSGPCQRQISTQVWAEDGRGGSVIMRVTYRNDDGETTLSQVAVSPNASQLLYAAEPTSAHDALETLAATAYPFQALPSAVEVERWMRGYTRADITVSYVGSVRPVDIAVVERPSQIAVDTASPTWPSALYVDAGVPYAELPSDYPITQLATLDPAGGLEAIRRALEQHGAQLGPCLAWYSSAQELASNLDQWIAYGLGTGDNEAPPFLTTSTTPVSLPYGVAATDAFPGYQLGGYARRARDSDEWLDGRTGVLPVWHAAYARSTNGRVQFRAGTSQWSAIEAPFTLGTFEWKVVPGWIEVGVGPEDAPVGRFWAWSPSGAQTRVRYAAVFHRQG